MRDPSGEAEDRKELLRGVFHARYWNPRQIVLDIGFHFYATIVLLLLGLFGAPAWSTLAPIAVFGLVIDGARHALSPECRIPLSVIRQKVENGVADERGFISRLAFWKAVFTWYTVVWIGAAAIFEFVTMPHEGTSLSSLLYWTGPLETGVSNIFRDVRDYPTQLYARGFSKPAELLRVFYVANAIALIFNALIMLSGYAYINCINQLTKFMRNSDTGLGRRQSLNAIRIGLPLGVLFLVIISDWIPISWKEHGTKYDFNVAYSNRTFFYYSMALSGGAWLIWNAYSGLVATRCMERTAADNLSAQRR